MKVIDKYISKKENASKPDATKTEISNEAFAVCEFIEELIKEVKNARTSRIGK